ncbi:MAG: hypothetical protein IPL89_15555 [Acidobacteria bacterium]|nr:hypothetical protein [Acidobacteriota bacterium]
MKRLSLATAVLLAATAAARADLNDGKPCFTYINPPGNGLRYVCVSTSSQTVEHPEPVTLTGKAWRTRITARREGEALIYDRTFDSFTAPASDPVVQAAFADAGPFVAGSPWTLDEPAVLDSATTAVQATPIAIPSTKTIQVTPVSFSSSSAPQVVCVGDLGEAAQFPGLPGPPCPAGATPVTLRVLDESVATRLVDRLDDTHTHIQTDVYSSLLVTGELTSTHYEILARQKQPCAIVEINALGIWVTGIRCTSTSRQSVPHMTTASISANSWSTRITGHLRGGPDLFDVTINATAAPESDAEVRQALANARQATAEAAGPGAAVNGPILLSSSVAPVKDLSLAGGATLTQTVQTLSLPPLTDVCGGDLGELPGPPSGLPGPPCGPGILAVRTRDTIPWIPRNIDTNTHTQRDVYASLFVTGTLTTTHYEYVGESSSALTLTIPIVLSPSGGSAFTSELTLANFAASDTQASFAYTPAFGGTPGTVTDTLHASTQRIVPDAIAYLKSLGLTDPGAGGVLRMTFEGAVAPSVYASVRTTAAVPEGRVGLAYPALPPSKLFSSPVVLPGLRQNALDRSNVAVLNAGAPADGDVTLRLTVSSGDPANPQSRALPDVTLPPGGFSQISSILVSNGLALSNGYVRVERISGTAPFYAYAVVNDQATADGSFIQPIAASPASQIASTTLPVVVETPAYSTELVLTNFSATARTLNFTWVAPALSGGRATLSVNLLPNEQQILPGFVQLLRDRGAVTDTRGPSFAGALFVSDSTGDLRGIAISARILSALGGGRVGVALPSYPSGSESTTPVWLCGLQQNATTRSNLALVNMGSVDASPSTFRIDLYDGTNGAKVASPVASVPAKGFVQIDRILASYAPGVTQGCALVTRTSGSSPFLAYAVLNDGTAPGQRSGDGAYVASVPASP